MNDDNLLETLKFERVNGRRVQISHWGGRSVKDPVYAHNSRNCPISQATVALASPSLTHMIPLDQGPDAELQWRRFKTTTTREEEETTRAFLVVPLMVGSVWMGSQPLVHTKAEHKHSKFQGRSAFKRSCCNLPTRIQAQTSKTHSANTNCTRPQHPSQMHDTTLSQHHIMKISDRRENMGSSSQSTNINSNESLHTFSSNVSSLDSLDSLDNLDFDRSSLSTRYTKFERYFKQLVRISREVLGRDHTFDRHGHRFLNIDRYLCLRDKIHNWITQPGNAALFADRAEWFYLAQMAAAMNTIEIALALPHKQFAWPGAAPGLDPYWSGVGKRGIYRRFDELIHESQDLGAEAMPWNRKEDVGNNGYGEDAVKYR